MFILKSKHEKKVEELEGKAERLQVMCNSFKIVIEQLQKDNNLAQQCIANQRKQIYAYKAARSMQAKAQKRDNNGRFSK
jgi:uncharacterized protein (DUF3084 family)